MDKIAVLIPCYNEEKTIYKVVTDFKAVLPDSTIYVYDNNSSDKTSELAEKAGAVVRKEYKQGKGNVIRRMFSGSESKLNTYSDGIKVLLTIVKLYKNYKPFGFFTAISLVLALCSILFFIPVLSAYFKTGVVDRFPTLIVCGFVMVMAILFFAVGVLLSTLRSQDKRDFEYKLIQVDHMKKTSK